MTEGQRSIGSGQPSPLDVGTARSAKSLVGWRAVMGQGPRPGATSSRR